MVLEYNPLKIGNRTINVRNWKVKDRDNFKILLSKAITPKEQENALYQSLVFSVLETPIALNRDELEYLFILLRIKNLGEFTYYNHLCPKCDKTSRIKLSIKDLISVSFGELSEINVNNIKLELQEIQNVKYYNDLMAKTEEPLKDDLILHIKALNENESLGYDDIKKTFDDFDTTLMDEIFDLFEKMIFTIDSREYSVECPECKSSTNIIFDEIPDLLPNKWTKR